MLLRDSSSSNWPQISVVTTQHLVLDQECRPDNSMLTPYHDITPVSMSSSLSSLQIPKSSSVLSLIYSTLRRDFVTAPPKRVGRESSNKLDTQKKRPKTLSKSQWNTNLLVLRAATARVTRNLRNSCREKFRSGFHVP